MKVNWLFLILSASSAFAEDLYVTPTGGGSRDGTSWANAFAGLAGVAWGGESKMVGAGDTLWVAGGTYTSRLTIGASGTVGARIMIKRVKANDPVPTASAGWNPAFDSQAVIENSLRNPCILFTGGVGSFVTIDGREEYGIKCLFKDGSSGVEIDSTPGTISNITLQYIEAAGPGPIVQTADTRGFDLTITGTIENLRVSHCSAHHCDTTFQIGRTVGLVVEYCQFYDAFAVNTSTYHPNTMVLTDASNGIIRFNKFYNIWVEGLFFESGIADNMEIYGNLFEFGNVPTSYAGRGIEFGFNAVGTNCKIYNNTFVGFPFYAIRLTGPSYAGTMIKNNIFYNCRADFRDAAHDFNLFSGPNAEPNGIANAPDPFVGLGKRDYRLQSETGRSKARNNGQALGPPFDVDLDGHRRGADGHWDIGAYEFTADGAPAITSGRIRSGAYRTPFEYSITGSNQPTSYSLSGTLPPGLTFKEDTGAISGTPTEFGIWEVTLSAANSRGIGATILTLDIDPMVFTLTGAGARTGRDERLVNFSSRAQLNPLADNQPVIAGFVIGGSTPRRILLRAVGPGLSSFDIPGALPNPRMRVFDSQGRLVVENDDWQFSSDLTAVSSTAGAFPLTANSRDAAVLAVLPPGVYTMEIDANGASGVALAEIYDAGGNPSDNSRRLANLSTRSYIGSPDGLMVSGLVIQGEVPALVLIRGIGPGLADFGVRDALPDPMLTLYRGSALVARNDNWETPDAVNAMQWAATKAEINAASSSVGAFTLRTGGKDSALVIFLAAGAYTAVLSGVAGSRGMGMIEVYLLSNP